MPIRNYCKKCRTEVNPGEVCPNCGAKLNKAGEGLRWNDERTPVSDWFSWNAFLRVIVPVIALIMLSVLVFEGLTEGAAGIQRVLAQDFFAVLLFVLGLMVLATMALLCLMGRESVRCVLDARGAHAFILLRNARPVQLRLRMLTPQTLESLKDNAPIAIADGYTLVKRTDIAWTDIQRMRCWPETRTLLFYRPRWWLALAMHCDEAVYADALEWTEKKLGRRKGVLKPKKQKRKA